MASTWNDVKLRIGWITKQDTYIIISYVLLVLLLGLLLNDGIIVVITEQSSKSTQDFSLAVLLLHTVGFYFGLLGFIYTTQTAGYTSSRKALAAVISHVVVFVLRVAYETACLGYREEFYRTSGDK